MSADGVIGQGGTLPWHYPADLKRFKRVTLHSTIIMGRKTWDSLPNKPLPSRQNIVITRNNLPGVEHYNTLHAAMENARYDTIWVIGGSSIYRLAIQFCTRMDITYVPDHVHGNDCVYFPDINWDEWLALGKNPFEDDDRLAHQQFTRVT